MNHPATKPASHWTSPRRIENIARWSQHWQTFTSEATQLLIQAVPPRAARVLDLASGAGDPAIHIAKAMPAARLTASDLGGDVLGLAAQTAKSMGLNNLVIREADAGSLPFPKSSFDAVTCRFGVMFFPDLNRALQECRRVVSPGGALAFMVWGSPDRPYFANTVQQVLAHSRLAPPAPDAPHPFRFAQPGKLRRALEDAGFRPAREQLCPITHCWPGSPSELWQFFVETTGTYQPYLESLSQADLAAIAARAQAAFEHDYDGKVIRLAGEVLLVTGTNP